MSDNDNAKSSGDARRRAHGANKRNINDFDAIYDAHALRNNPCFAYRSPATRTFSTAVWWKPWTWGNTATEHGYLIEDIGTKYRFFARHGE